MRIAVNVETKEQLLERFRVYLLLSRNFPV